MIFCFGGGRDDHYATLPFRATAVSVQSSVTRGRCNDNNFLQISPIFGEKIGVFSQKPML
jgi:hypothetical protein